MLEYEEIKFYNEESGGKNLILVENGSNTFKFYDFSSKDIGIIIKMLLSDD